MEPKIIPDTIYPNMVLVFDPTSDFAKVCPYCGEDFMANHLGRVFCPIKFGKHNYCKNKWKELQAEAKLVAASIPPVQVYKPPLPIPQQVSNQPVEKANQPVTIKPAAKPDELRRSKSIETIQIMLEGKDWKEFTGNEIIEAQLDLTVFDKQIPLPDSNLFRLEIGNFSIFWTHSKKILIINTIEITWIQ